MDKVRETPTKDGLSAKVDGFEKALCELIAQSGLSMGQIRVSFDSCMKRMIPGSYQK